MIVAHIRLQRLQTSVVSSKPHSYHFSMWVKTKQSLSLIYAYDSIGEWITRPVFIFTFRLRLRTNFAHLCACAVTHVWPISGQNSRQAAGTPDHEQVTLMAWWVVKFELTISSDFGQRFNCDSSVYRILADSIVQQKFSPRRQRCDKALIGLLLSPKLASVNK